MIAAQESKLQLVVPRWLTYKDAVKSGELFFPETRSIIQDSTFESDYERFQKDNHPLLASDLLGRAFALERPEEARSLAAYIVDSPNIQQPTKNLAKRILGFREDISSSEHIYKEIHASKKYLQGNPHNPAKWIDLARLYTTINQFRPAATSIRAALALAPLDRFCLRAAVRCFLHFRDHDEAYDLFKKEPQRLKDPWLLAAATSVAQMADKPSFLPRRLQPNIKSKEHAFHMSELIEAVGMQEWINGSERQSKKLFRQAWINPTVNVVTHADWLLRTYLPGMKQESGIDMNESKAAQSYEKFSNGDITGARRAADDWIHEEPYSKSPLVRGSYVASVMEDYRGVVDYFNRGQSQRLIHPILLNNYAFALLQMNKLSLASLCIQTLEKDYADGGGFAVEATKGLFEIKSGNIEAGRALYKEAFKIAEKSDPSAKNRVLLHEYLAVLRVGIGLNEDEIRQLREIKRQQNTVDELLLVQKVETSIETNASNSTQQVLVKDSELDNTPDNDLHLRLEQ